MCDKRSDELHTNRITRTSASRLPRFRVKIEYLTYSNLT